jgi:uncharacterized Ntn-hydrolase superfamily protein
MTISILAFDEKAGSYGGAAATGSLCVGGWVLRGDPESGLSASQGSLPSTLWGCEVLRRMKEGASASAAVPDVTGRDAGRDQRQLSALDPAGGTGGFTGGESIPAAGVRQARHVIVAGNMLTSEDVLDAALKGFLEAKGDLDQRLLQALGAAAAAGGDSRGFLSAALLVVSRDKAPLTLRIDHAEDPLADLRALHGRATTGAYARWSALVPTLDDPERSEPYLDSVG